METLKELKILGASFSFIRIALDGNFYIDENRCILDNVQYAWNGSYQEGAGNHDDYKIFTIG